MVSLIDELMTFFGLSASEPETFVQFVLWYGRILMAFVVVAMAFIMIHNLIKQITRGL